MGEGLCDVSFHTLDSEQDVHISPICLCTATMLQQATEYVCMCGKHPPSATNPFPTVPKVQLTPDYGQNQDHAIVNAA